MRFVIISFLILFSLLTLAPNMQGAQFLKVGEMIEHYEEDYQDKGLSIASFIDFLEEHYTKQLDLNQDDHKELPFKSVTPSFIQLCMNEIKIQAIIIENQFEFKEKTYFSEPSFKVNQGLYTIWNPPRI